MGNRIRMPRAVRPHGSRPLSRVEKRFRRDVKRELLSARSALMKITLETAGGLRDSQPYALLAAENAAAIARYREARTVYALVFGGLVS